MAKKNREARKNMRISNSDWLYELLTETRADLAARPSPDAIARIRATLEAEINSPAELAA